jgi:hypothetical protein
MGGRVRREHPGARLCAHDLKFPVGNFDEVIQNLISRFRYQNFFARLAFL